MIFHLYGFLIGLGIISGLWVAEKINSKFFLLRKSDLLIFKNNSRFFVIITFFSLLGARLLHVLSNLGYYFNHPREIFFLWQGGLSIFGALAGGVFGLLIFIKTSIKTRSLNEDRVFPKILDFLSFGLPVAQAVGRLGNFINQEVYGLPTNLPWKIFIKPENRLPQFTNISYYQPLFAYEIVLNLLIFGILFMRVKRRNSPGQLFLTYLFLYSLGRFFLEFLRIDPWMIWGIRVNQIIAGIIVIGSYKKLFKF